VFGGHRVRAARRREVELNHLIRRFAAPAIDRLRLEESDAVVSDTHIIYFLSFRDIKIVSFHFLEIKTQVDCGQGGTSIN